jgi:hypothetical protein
MIFLEKMLDIKSVNIEEKSIRLWLHLGLCFTFSRLTYGTMQQMSVGALLVLCIFPTTYIVPQWPTST